MSTPVLYGIPNCDTMKKARAWLAAQGIEVTFHDYKKLGITAEVIEGWLAQGATLDALVNATGWLPHTTRAVLTGLRKRGFEIDRTQGRTTCTKSAI